MIRITEQLTPKRQITFVIPDNIGLDIYRNGDTFEIRKTGTPVVKETLEIAMSEKVSVNGKECFAKTIKEAIRKNIPAKNEIVAKMRKAVKR